MVLWSPILSGALNKEFNAPVEVYFMTFTFTSKPVAEKLAELESKGVQVYGIYEARQKSKYCTFDFLKQSGAERSSLYLRRKE